MTSSIFGILLCAPCVPDIHRFVHILGQCSCTLHSALLPMRAWHSLHITIKAQTQKNIEHWTQLLRAFLDHGSGALIVVLLRNGTGSRRVTFWDDGTNQRALTPKSHFRCSLGGMTTGRCGQQGSEITQSWQVGLVCSRWRKRRQRRSRWLGYLLRRFGWVRLFMQSC